VKASFELTRGHFLLVLGCVLSVMLPLWLLEAWLASPAEARAGGLFVKLLLDALVGLLQLLPTVMLFRCFMLCTGQERNDG